MHKGGSKQAAHRIFWAVGILLAALAWPQLLAAAPCGNSAPGLKAAGLTRQIAAIRGLQARHSCFGGADAGFACRDLQMRLVAAMQDLASETRATNVRAASCAPSVAPLQASLEKPRAPRIRREAGERRRGPNLVTMCVRLSDGYYFPSPNSGYMSRKDQSTILAQCQLICDTPDMDVYRLTGVDETADTMNSLTTGKAYTDLKSANAFRKKPDYQRCDMTRYYRLAAAQAEKAEEAAAPAPTVITESDSSVTTVTVASTTPAPAAEPAAATSAATDDILDVARWSLRGSTAEVRHVRMVGPAYLPEN